jgi:pimeloyl-ACP methyl ester carboxylesterase
METIKLFQRYLLATLFLIVFFACQDPGIDTVQQEIDRSEDITQYLVDNPEVNARHARKTYVLVHGAWHPSAAWNDVKRTLEMCGNTVVAVQLQGLGNDTTPVETVTFNDHVTAVKNVVVAQSGSVILVGHSYGGAVISQVGEEVPRKIRKLVYVNGFMPVDGESVVQLALSDTESLVTQNLIIDGAIAYLTPEDCANALYNQALASCNGYIVDKAKEILSLCRPHPVATLVVPVHLTDNYNHLEKVYISCLKDKAVTPGAQQSMYSRFPGTLVYTIGHSDHSPFVTTPVTLVNILRAQ